MLPQLNIEIDEEMFNILQPPPQYPPSLEYLMQQNDKYFIKQCKKFLNHQKDLYMLSNKIQSNLHKVLDSNKQLEEIVLKKDINSDKIYKELEKLNQTKTNLQKRQKTLQMICQLIKLEKLKSLLLLEGQKTMSQELVLKLKKKSASSKNIATQVEIAQPITQEQKRYYLQNLKKIYFVVKQSKTLDEYMNRQKFPLIQNILIQLHELFSNAIDKALSPQLLTPDMIKLILTQFYQPFLYESDLYIRAKKTPKQKFKEIMISNRVQKYRLQLNPIINNLNYANNVIDLYDSILVSWVRIIDEDLKFFSYSKETSIVKTATKILLNEAMPKLQKNTYKMKEMGQICYIRFRIHQFLHKLQSIQILQQKQHSSEQKWDPLPSMIERMKILLGSKIKEQSQKLSMAKYNIYSLTSYLPIREYLQTIKQCIEYDFQRPPDLQFLEEQKQKSTQKNGKKYTGFDSQKYLDWQEPFFQLAISRKPQLQPNNKSLVIFNLNIWYLYLKIIKQPSHKIIAVQTMIWCKQTFIQMNVRQCCKIYYESLDKILQMCGNIPTFRNVLYAQINMLGHEDLRKQIAQGIQEKFIFKYQEMLEKVGKQKMNNEEVKLFCKENKINLNKFGKFSSQICIFSKEELQELIQYN